MNWWRLTTLLFATASWSASSAQELQEFRAPNEIESAYVGVAAALEDPLVCSLISPRALNRVRKPSLTRSLCFYHVALATSSTDPCAHVDAIPSETGMMVWLDPMRCQQQVRALADTPHRAPRPTNLGALLSVLGYTNVPEANNAQMALFQNILSTPDERTQFEERLASAPDYSSRSDVTTGYTEDDARHETNWVLGRALRLCAAGRGGNASCDEKAIQLVREQGLRRVGLAPPSDLTQHRYLTNFEEALLVWADMLRDPNICKAIGPDALSVGWSSDPGLEFVPSRSACLFRVAAITNTPGTCRDVVRITDETLDGARATASECQRAVRDNAKLFPAPSLRPDWASALADLGYKNQDLAKDRESLNGLISKLANPLNAEHTEFRARLNFAARYYDVEQTPSEKHFYNEADLQLAAYQFSATRFHCSLDWSDVASKSGQNERPYWVPETPTYALESLSDNRVTEQDFAGKYSLVYFGFTSCPDVCPISLSTMRTALRQLGDSADDIQPIFITLDPARDSVEILDQYVSMFGDDFIGLTGNASEIAQAADSFNVYFYAGEIDGVYTVEHTSYYYLVGPDGKSVKYFEYGVNAKDMATELAAILSGQPPSPGGETRRHTSE